jgi:predicted ArsR family transcriptional regulator
VQDTRRRILELLRRGGGLTVEDLTHALRVTRTAITTQLAALQAEGLVTRGGLRRGQRRPSVVYALTPAADALFPKAYEDFAASLLEEIKRAGDTDLKRVLTRISDRWIRRDLPLVEGLKGPARLQRVREILEERGFMPALDRTSEGYLLREHNCPVMRLAQEHAEVCDMVHRWLEALFGTKLTRVRCLRRGDPFSAYTMLQNSRGRIQAHKRT